MKYLFLVGRNIELSIAEMLFYFENLRIKVRIEKIKSNGILLDSNEELDLGKALKQLGGVVAIGKVIISGDLDSISMDLLERQIYLGSSNKVIYSIFNFANENALNLISSNIKLNFKKEGLKAKYIAPKGFITTQKGETIFGSPTQIKKVDERYFLFKLNTTYFFGNLTNVYDTKETEKRDMNKPARRESLAISPRLAKILINLSGVKKNENILDPFCGIGVILQEALLNKINAFGIDIDKEATIDCKKNLNWLVDNYKVSNKSKVYHDDSGKFSLNLKVDGIATEPSLSKVLKKIPKKSDALKMINEFEQLMIYVLKNLKKNLNENSKIAFTSPYILLGKKRISCDINKICLKTGLKQYKFKDSEVIFPIHEFREDQVVGRDIYVLMN